MGVVDGRSVITTKAVFVFVLDGVLVLVIVLVGLGVRVFVGEEVMLGVRVCVLVTV